MKVKNLGRNVLIVALILGLLLAGCAAPAVAPSGASESNNGGAEMGRTIKIGYVSPQTGPLAPFGEADAFILAGIREAAKDGIEVAGQKHPIEIIVKDSQSDPNKAAEVAADLILKDEVDLIVVASTPETTNPVSDQCEANGVPCISTVAPWQPWFFGRGGDPAKGFEWTYHFFWGLEDIIGVFVNTWDSLETNKIVGGMWPNDGDGLAWSDAKLGFPPALEAAGYTVVDPGRYENLKDDFSAEISLFKEQNVEIVTGVMIPPDLGTFLTQAAQQGFYPKAFTVGKAALFPVVVETIPDGLGDGLTTEIWWTPNHPFKSSLTGVSAEQLAGAYSESTKKQWTQPIGFAHALFEVAIDTLKRTSNLDDKAAIRDAIKATKLDTIVGSISWEGGPVPNVAKTPLVGGQWVKSETYPFELTITDNSSATTIPDQGEPKVMTWGK